MVVVPDPAALKVGQLERAAARLLQGLRKRHFVASELLLHVRLQSWWTTRTQRNFEGGTRRSSYTLGRSLTARVGDQMRRRGRVRSEAKVSSRAHALEAFKPLFGSCHSVGRGVFETRQWTHRFRCAGSTARIRGPATLAANLAGVIALSSDRDPAFSPLGTRWVIVMALDGERSSGCCWG